MATKRQTVFLKRMTRPLLILAAVFVIGTAGYKIIGGDQWSLSDIAFMVVYSLTTVDYGDILDVQHNMVAKVYTIILLVAGIGAVTYSVSEVAALVVEGHLTHLFLERRMERTIAGMSGHYILCGVGETGIHVLEELRRSQVPCVVVDSDLERLNSLRESWPNLLYVHGDADERDILVRAGVKRAAGLVATLSADKDNMFVVVTAKFLRPDLKIVTKCVEHENVLSFQHAGASYVVSSNFIGGLRIASEMLRPHVVTFLDRMLRDPTGAMRVAEVTVQEGARIANLALRNCRIHEETGLLVIALLRKGKTDFEYNPIADDVIEPGSVLIVIGTPERIDRLKAMASA